MIDIKANLEKRDIIAPLFEKQQYVKNYVTVSDVKTLVTDKFNSDGIAEGLVAKNFNNPASKYYQMTKEQILKSWDEKAKASLNYGKLLDAAVEQILETRDDNEWETFLLDNNFDIDEKFTATVNAMTSFIEKCASQGIEYVGREIPVMYTIDDVGAVKGRIDCLLYNKSTKKYIIIDWKTDDTIDIEPNHWTKRCLGPATDLYQLNGYTYTLQLYSYKAALLQTVLNGEDLDNIQCFICNCPKFVLEEKPLWRLIPVQFKYNKEQLDKIYTFCIKKKQIELRNKQ